MAARSVLMLHPGRLGLPSRGESADWRAPAQAVAIRVPDRMAVGHDALIPRSSPRLYVHEGARQALERRIEAASTVPVSLAITDNLHSVISHSWHRGVLRARVHHMFLDAPRSIQHALVRYVTEADRDASLTLGSFIEARADRLARRSRNRKLVTRGKHHDLLAIFAEVNERYFGGTESGAQITWGRRASRPERPRSSIKLGSYDATERLIRIHPVLDRPWVPRYFVAFIVFHELLHHVMPTGRLERTPRARTAAHELPPPGSRRALHSAAFRERERTFRYYERALAWEKKNLARLLRS